MDNGVTRAFLAKWLPVGGALVGLGSFFYVALGYRRVGLSFISFSAALVALYVGSLIIPPLRNAVILALRQLGHLASALRQAAADAYNQLPSFITKLLFALLIAWIFLSVGVTVGGFGGRYVKEQERVALSHLTLADSCLKTDNYLCAEREIEAARKLLPTDFRVDETEIRARVLQVAVQTVMEENPATEQINRAKTDCEFLLNRTPLDPSLLALLGVVDSLLDDPYAAAEQFQRAVAANPAYPNVYNYWGFDILRWQLDERWPQLAREKLETSSTKNANYPLPLINLGLVVLTVEPESDASFRKAEGYFLRAKSASPNDQRVYTSLGSLYLGWGKWLEGQSATEEAVKKYAEAQTSLERSYAINPNNPYLLVNLGQLLSALNADHARVIQRFKDAVSQRPRYMLAYHELGHAYERAGNHVQAHASYNMALELSKEIVSSLEQRRNRSMHPESVGRRLGVWLAEKQELVAHLEQDIQRVSHNSTRAPL